MEYSIDVSVIIPMYNSESFIQDAIQSVLQQEPHGLQLEIIVVDDGSTDSSARLVSQIKNEKVRLITLPKNQGLPYARNAGLRVAQGEWIQFLDSDDQVQDELYSKLEKSLQPDMNCYLFSFIRQLPSYSIQQTIKTVNDKRAFGHFGGSVCNKFIKKDICQEFKPFLYSEDVCYSVDMMNGKELYIGLIKDTYYLYNKKRAQSITANFNKSEFTKMFSYVYNQIDNSDKKTKMYILEIGLSYLFDRNIPLSVSLPIAMKTFIKLFPYFPVTYFNQNRKYIENVKI